MCCSMCICSSISPCQHSQRVYRSNPGWCRWPAIAAWMNCAGDARCPEVLFSTLEREQRGEGLSPLEAIPDSEPLPEEITENTELQSLLRAAMVSLPPQF